MQRVSLFRLRGPSCAVHRDNFLLLLFNQTTLGYIVHSPKRIKRYILQILSAYSAGQFQGHPVRKDFQCAPVCNPVVLCKALNLRTTLYTRPIGDRCALDFAEGGQCAWQSQTEVRHFKKRVVTVADYLRVKFHDASSPQVIYTIFHFMFKNLIENVLEQFTEMHGSFSSFRGVLCEVLEHRPEVDESSPINVTKVR